MSHAFAQPFLVLDNNTALPSLMHGMDCLLQTRGKGGGEITKHVTLRQQRSRQVEIDFTLGGNQILSTTYFAHEVKEESPTWIFRWYLSHTPVNISMQ